MVLRRWKAAANLPCLSRECCGGRHQQLQSVQRSKCVSLMRRRTLTNELVQDGSGQGKSDVVSATCSYRAVHVAPSCSERSNNMIAGCLQVCKYCLAHRACSGNRHRGGVELETVRASQVGSVHIVRNSSSDCLELPCASCPLLCPVSALGRRFRHPHFRLHVSDALGAHGWHGSPLICCSHNVQEKICISSASSVKRIRKSPRGVAHLLVAFAELSQRFDVISELLGAGFALAVR